MNAIANIIPPDGVLLHLKASSLDSAMEQVSALAAEVTGLRTAVIQDALMARAKLGASMGDGILIPHARLPGLRRIVGFFARPLVPIETQGSAPITMIFVLLAPEDADAAHLKVLARIAGIIRNAGWRDVLLKGDRDAVYQLLTSE
jgi:PTS system nitrogen regulatory IIA component